MNVLFPFFFPLFDNANGRLVQENIVESQKVCYHGNVTSHLSSLLPCCLGARSIELLFLIISNAESAIGVTERGKISMHGNQNII